MIRVCVLFLVLAAVDLASAAPVKVSERFGFDPEDSTLCL